MSSWVATVAKRRRANRLSFDFSKGPPLDENSFVDNGAQEIGVLPSLLVKSLDGTTTQLGFMPLHITKGSIADGSWPDEDPLDPDNDGDDDSNPATDPDMDFTGRVARKRKKSMKKFLKKIIKASRDFSNGQDGQGFHSGSDVVGVQDARSSDEVADDALEIARTIKANPPTAQERRWSDYAARVFGDAVKDFTSAELAQAKLVFAAVRDNVLLQKSAGDAMTQAGFAVKLQHPELTTQQAFAKAARDNPELYAASRGIVKADYSPRTVSTMSVAGDDVDSLTPEQCGARIAREADHIQQTIPGTKRTHALIMAAQRHPGAYMKSKDCPLG